MKLQYAEIHSTHMANFSITLSMHIKFFISK